MALNFITWLWGGKYGARDVARLHAAVAKHVRHDHRFFLFTDWRISSLDLPSSIIVRPIIDTDLCARACFCRLRMFDPKWQSDNGIKAEDRIVSVDLDIVPVADMCALFDRPETFLILQGANAVNPNPFNASVMMLRAAHHREVWESFSVDEAFKTPYHEFPDDQGWIWHMLPHARGWQVGAKSGIYAFEKPGWPKGTQDLPRDAKLVVFFGKRKPAMYQHLPWMQQHWAA